MLDVYTPGSDVVLWGGVHAKVIAVMVEHGPNVSYKVAWPNGLAMTEQWVSSLLLERHEPQTTTLGFK